MPPCPFLDALAPVLTSPLPFLVGGLLTGIRRWRAAPPPSSAGAAYAVACGSCGRVATGLRQAESQVVRCAGCGEDLFVLPLSRLPRLAPPGDRRRAEGGTARPVAGLRIWAWPAVAVALTVLALVIAYQFVVAPQVAERAGRGDGTNRPAKAAPGEFAARLAAARAQTGRGNFRLALEELRAARTAGEAQPWSRGERQEWAQLQRQAALLADLSAESLEEILRHAAGVQEREWQAEFRTRYQGKGLVLDLEVRAGLGGRPEHDWLLRVRDETAHLDLSDLELLRRLPLEGGQRLLFGARLASVRREPGRGWVARLESDSGVLITDPGAAVACFLSPEEAEVRALLERQAQWVSRDAAAPP